jgi:spore maturation protein CgeB
VRLVMFCHSIRSDWNHGNAHFLRGVCTELLARGHEVAIFEPRDGWSATQLAADCGANALKAYREAYPNLESEQYDRTLDLERALDRADLVLVHEWTDRDIIGRIGKVRARGASFVLLFHDTHHRSVTRPEELSATDLSAYDGVLAFGNVIAQRYRIAGWARRVWTWHEAADARVFRPQVAEPDPAPLVWIGNWGDDERRSELNAFLLEPVRRLGISGRVFGVRYPDDARTALNRAGLGFSGWTPNFHVPAIFARHRVTVHVPRAPYSRHLPGIPTIRMFEALACGIPLVSAPWDDAEGLFRPGVDYLVARSTAEMAKRLRDVLDDQSLAASLREHGRGTIAARHTCAHRVEELLAIHRGLTARSSVEAVA